MKALTKEHVSFAKLFSFGARRDTECIIIEYYLVRPRSYHRGCKFVEIICLLESRCPHEKIELQELQ